MSTLRDTQNEGLVPAAARQLAGGNRKFPYRLTFNRTDVVEFRVHAAEHMSISGIQDKISLKLIRGKLEPTATQGEYILKPVPTADIPRLKSDVAANEHVVMQIASQVFGIAVPPNAVIHFADGELAYIVKRFDRRNGQKIGQEDFCQLSNRSEETAGRNYKYDSSYEEVGRILRQFCKAYPVEIEKLFARILFNYVFSNGDAHLKNFSLFKSDFGDYVLTPAYDLLCTSLHFPTEARTALEMFDEFETESFRQNAFYKRPDFLRLGELYSIRPERAENVLERFASGQAHAADLIDRSFLSSDAKQDFQRRFQDRLRAIAD
ncbi:MAG: HipA domain-containing protein [Kiritimatiellia bacterium]|jgi:serine/threonine-protein kinase HipA|nr:HipA domain-containing protein [Kiritimatiellia bacterium]MDP7024326.1 HipA domain-containing protein [Kiritimatiellia bacterium]